MRKVNFIKADTKELLAFVEDIYMEAFPENERKPFSMLMDGQKKGNVEILVAELEEDKTGENPNTPDGKHEFWDRGKCAVGELILAKHADVVLLDYFAVNAAFRGRGIGALLLRKLQEYCKGKRLLLEIESTKVEAENKKQRLSRKAFYERCGLQCMDYSVEVFGVEMEVLTFGCEVGFEEYYTLYREVYGAEVGAQIRRKV